MDDLLPAVSRRRFLRWAARMSALGLALLSGCGRRLAGRRQAMTSPTFSPPPTAAPPTATPVPPTPPPPTQVPPTPAPATPTALPPSPTAVRVLASPTAPPATATSTAVPLPPERAADTLLLHGKVITVDAQDTIAQALAIKGDTILAVGSDEGVGLLRGASTQVIDLQGRTCTPGLVDAHNHVQVMGQMGSYYLPLMPPEVRTLEDMRAKLAAQAKKTPKGEWIQGYFIVVSEGRLPNREDLDPASPEHPIWVVQQGGHYGSANSMALQMAGITANTRDPEGGVIERDSRGQPTGVFYNHRAMDLLRRVIPRFTPEEMRKGILETVPLFVACGLTSFQDNNVRGASSVETYQQIAAEGLLGMRGVVYFTLEWPGDVDRALKEVDYATKGDLRFGGFKFLLDGQARMAYCHEPHGGMRWDLPTWEPGSFKRAVRALHETGLQICVHCAGDAAVDLTLDAYEEAMNAYPRPDPRHRIEHGILSTADATKRMKDLGVVISTQPQFLRIGATHYSSLFGPQRAGRLIVTREWLDAGVHLALGSDAPTTPWYTPNAALFSSVMRVDPAQRRFHPEQAMTLPEALRAHTLGAAYAAHEEKVKGSIEPGKLADLAVWAKDPYTAPLNELWNIPIDLTMIGGEVVYQR